MLPEKYIGKMKKMLQEEYDDYLASFDCRPYKGLRINTSKISIKDFLGKFPFSLEPIPWTSDGFYYKDENVSKHPYYYAGLYYLQEPSAMLPAEVLPINENDIVLDACAAPGGKSLKLLTKLNSTGLLISNDISVSRGYALLRNIERQGFDNFYVVAEDVEKLANKYPRKFTKILLDGPCSGEGMFRKDPSLIKSWLDRDSDYYSQIQKNLLVNCIDMLKDGGKIVYSTCTFDEKEDEEVVEYALEKFPNLKVLPIKMFDGFKKGKNNIGVKLFPHKIKGEGHFVCLLQKGDETSTNTSIEKRRIEIDNRVYIVPDFDVKGLRTLRSGLYVGENRKYRFEFSQAYALSLKEFSQTINLSINDERTTKYLKGETITYDCDLKGDVLVCVDQFPLGFARIDNGIVKNKIDKGWILR